MDEEKAARCRRSSRISALEEKARLLSLQEKTNKGQTRNNAGLLPSSVPKKRSRKRKTHLQLAVNSVATEEGDESEDEREFFQQGNKPSSHLHDEQSKFLLSNLHGIRIFTEPTNSDSLPACPSIPEQRILEFILDLLQRRDTQEIFAQPVDPSEVEGYYDVVKEPMDFGTMRAKLQEGMYSSLKQFERDVLLISSNAMAFNAPTTMIYQEAQALRESAHKVFHNLQTEPEKFRVECSRTRRRPGKKPLADEAGDSSSKPTRPGTIGNNVHARRTAKTLPVPFLFSRFSTGRHSGSPSQNSRSGVRPRDTDRRMTYQPPTGASKSDRDDDDHMKFSFNPDALRKLVRTPFTPGAYEDSINRFSKDLGPVAQRIAQKKLAELRAIWASERKKAPGSTQAPWIPVLAGSKPSTMVPQLSQNFAMGHEQWGHPFLGRRPEESREASSFMSVAPILPDRRSVINLLPAQYKACHNQVPELSADRRSHGRTSSGIPNGLTFASTRFGSQVDRLFPAPPSVHMHTFLRRCGKEQAHQDINNFSASNKGKEVNSDDGRINLSFFRNPISNAKRGSITGAEGRLASPVEQGSAQRRTSLPDEESVEQFLAIMGDNNSPEAPTGQRPFDLDSDFLSASSSSQLAPPSTLSSSLLGSPSGGMWLPFQSENRLDQQTTKSYLRELRSGCFNAIAKSDAALRYPNESNTNPVGLGQLSPMAPGLMHHFPGRQMQVNEHDPSHVRTAFPLQQPRLAPSQRVPPLNWAGPSGGIISQVRRG